MKDLKKIVVLSVTNDLATDQRVQKVAQTLLNMGFEVILVGRLLKGSLPVPQFKHHRMKLFFTKGVAFYTAYHFRLFLFLLLHFLQRGVLLSGLCNLKLCLFVLEQKVVP